MVQKVEKLQVKSFPFKTNVKFLILASKSQKSNKSPLLVHCSAGVGRTGTFIALYKLWYDYYNPEVKTLSLLPTVVALRAQRCLMVQKCVQYRYGKPFFSSIKVDQTIY